MSTPEPPSVSVRRCNSQIFLPYKRGRNRRLSIGSSSISDNNGGSRTRYTRQKNKPRLGIQPDKIVAVKDWHRNNAGLSDTDRGVSTTDLDIETDNTLSDSDSDGYTQGTKT
jgi:hypothetical protein